MRKILFIVAIILFSLTFGKVPFCGAQEILSRSFLTKEASSVSQNKIAFIKEATPMATIEIFSPTNPDQNSWYSNQRYRERDLKRGY